MWGPGADQAVSTCGLVFLIWLDLARLGSVSFFAGSISPMKISSSGRLLSFRFPLSRAARAGALFLLLLVGLSAAQPCSADDGGTLVVARISHTATLLADGHVLLLAAGGKALVPYSRLPSYMTPKLTFGRRLETCIRSAIFTLPVSCPMDGCLLPAG